MKADIDARHRRNVALKAVATCTRHLVHHERRRQTHRTCSIYSSLITGFSGKLVNIVCVLIYDMGIHGFFISLLKQVHYFRDYYCNIVCMLTVEKTSANMWLGLARDALAIGRFGRFVLCTATIQPLQLLSSCATTIY